MNALPELSDDRVDEIENAVFREIARDRERQASTDAAAARSRRSRRRWGLGAIGTAAAVLIVAVAIGPQLTATTTGSGASSTADGAADTFADEGVVPAPGAGLVPDTELEAGGRSAPQLEAPTGEGAGFETLDDSPTAASADRDVIATATATVRVDDPRAASEAVVDAAEEAGGYVETLSTGSADAAAGMDGRDVMSSQSGATNAWVTVRVPAEALAASIAALDEIGDVESSQITRDDVTTQAVDLRARVEAGRISVERLSDLLAQSGSLADLIAAESALSARQAELESLEQQLTALEGQVSLSTLIVHLVQPSPAVDADPAGFGDGIATGWNGLIATFNGVVVALGFLMPWLATIALVAAAVWGIVRVVRALRSRRRSALADDDGLER